MIHSLPGDFWLTPIMKFFTWLGYPQAYMVIIAIIYWSVDRKLGLRLAIFLPVAASLNSILKLAFHAPRPYWLDPDIKAIQTSNGFGMPSGHAQASTVWLYAANILKTRWIWFAAIVVAFMVGLSRIFLRVHSSSQVLAGWLIGIVLLILFAYFEKRILPWFLKRRLFIQLLWIGGISIFMLALGSVFVYLLKNWEMPVEWISNAADDLAGTNESILSSVGMGAVAGNAGGFLGVALGALLSHRVGGFDTRGSVWKRLLRSVGGLLSLSALYGIIMWIAPDEDMDVAYSIWRFFGFFLVSFYTIFLLPLLFRKTSVNSFH